MFATAANPAFLQQVTRPTSGWRYPYYAGALHEAPLGTPVADQTPALLRNPWRGLGRRLLAAGYVEWRYYAIVARAFHGIVGLALVNPGQHFPGLAEGGLLVIVTGVGEGVSPQAASAAAGDLPALTWMQLFPPASLQFTGDQWQYLRAEYAGHRLWLEQTTPAQATLQLTTGCGLFLRMTHCGLAGRALAPVTANDLRRTPGGHWTVHCPSPVAATTGELHLAPRMAQTLNGKPGGDTSRYASSTILKRLAQGPVEFSWQNASGYYEHSFGSQPLPLCGWDFLFVPDAEHGSAVVLQTYRGSRQLRYVEVCWLRAGEVHYQRFGAREIRLSWQASQSDPLIGVRLPTRRRVVAANAELRLELDNRIVRQLPLLRPQKWAVRHFFISEQIGFADWRLTTADGHLLASGSNQLCGGELAHFRWRVPRSRSV